MFTEMASDAALPYLQAIVFLITVAILAFSLSLRRRKRNLPPGPAGWPLIGCLLQCGSQVPLKFHEWSRKYGNVMSLQLGSQLVIVLSSYDVIKEAFVKNSNIFSSRPKSYAVARVTKEKGINTPWVKWKHTHKFISKTFREFGLGKQIMAERVRTEGDILVEYIDSRSNTPINLKHVFANAVSNITCSMLFGKRFDYEDPDFKLLLQMSNQNVVTMMQASVLTFFPFLWYLPTQVKRNFITAQSELVSYMKQKIIERREQFTGEEPENIIDAFFLEDKEAEWDDDKIIELVHTVKGIFIAGTDSTAATLLWAILYLVLHQEIQDRCYSEIVKAIGYERHPEIADRASLPYVDATCLEVFRCSTVGPLGFPRSASEDANLCGYHIPKDAIVMASVWSVHMDENRWYNPREFNPGRFLDDDGNVINRKSIIPFGLGPRDCSGSDLARMQIFVFITRLLQRFRFILPPDSPVPSMDGTFGMAHLPDQYEVLALPRH